MLNRVLQKHDQEAKNVGLSLERWLAYLKLDLPLYETQTMFKIVFTSKATTTNRVVKIIMEVFIKVVKIIPFHQEQTMKKLPICQSILPEQK